jgi:hypothetical protein
LLVLSALVLSAACAGAQTPATAPATTITRAGTERLLTALADDSMEGRRTLTAGEVRAAKFIAGEFAALGLQPMGGDSGYYQWVPLVPARRRNGTVGYGYPAAGVLDTISKDQIRYGRNIIARLEGSDPTLKNEIILVDAHYDHLGIGRQVNGDSIYNGADDDASGVVTVLQVARAMTAGPRPKRTIIFATFTGEEMGLLGARWFVDHPTVPLDKMVANLEIEMIGRPDSLAGGPGKAWLTGYERSTMGDLLAANGIPIIKDPRPDQQFFQRSDNYALATRGIVAHTLSSFNLHNDYHAPSDDVSRVDFDHMTAVIQATVQAVGLLANGPTPAWHPGGRPTQ